MYAQYLPSSRSGNASDASDGSRTNPSRAADFKGNGLRHVRQAAATFGVLPLRLLVFDEETIHGKVTPLSLSLRMARSNEKKRLPPQAAFYVPA
jgi:hypothetical protein